MWIYVWIGAGPDMATPIQNWLGNVHTHKTMALEEVLDGVLVKEVILDVIVVLVQQLAVLGDEVSINAMISVEDGIQIL